MYYNMYWYPHMYWLLSSTIDSREKNIVVLNGGETLPKEIRWVTWRRPINSNLHGRYIHSVLIMSVIIVFRTKTENCGIALRAFGTVDKIQED